ncbi:hypothetical protein MY5147_000487 [Beauveria neobassiana]
MPAPGDQHKAWANPYEEPRPRISEWTAKEIATISVRLDKQLGPEYISSRAGPGGTRVHYLTAEKCINLANEIFGFNGWSSSIQNIQVDFADENPQTQRVNIGLSVIVRITLRDGTYHEDIGYGSIENARGKAMAFEKAKKEGTTDALKRTLRSFGNVLGNCIYDQDYVKQVTKLKAQPVKKFAQDNLHRHADFVKKDAPVIYTTPEAATAASASGSSSDPSFASAAAAAKAEASESFEDFLGGKSLQPEFKYKNGTQSNSTRQTFACLRRVILTRLYYQSQLRLQGRRQDSNHNSNNPIKLLRNPFNANNHLRPRTPNIKDKQQALVHRWRPKLFQQKSR